VRTAPLPSALLTLHALRAAGLGVWTSQGPLYRSALFGRDSLEVGEDLLDGEPGLAAQILLTLARLQGVAEDPVSEEEPGRIHHESRRRPDRSAPDSEHELYEALMAKWGRGGDQLIYYGSVDATPLFVRLAGRFCERHGEGLLRVIVHPRRGVPRHFGDSIASAAGWLLRRLERSVLGLLEYKRVNPDGLVHQGWKDSKTAYIHADGKPLATEAPIAALPVQGLAYDALRHAARILRGDEAFARRLNNAAHEIAERVEDHFWLNAQARYSPAIEAGANGPRPSTVESSDAGAFLDSRCLEVLSAKASAERVEAVARSVFSDRLHTVAGVRCRSATATDLVRYADYHGSWMSWPKETFDTAKGLRAWGMPSLARHLEIEILDAVNAAGELFEFFAISPEGEALYDPYADSVGAREISTTNLPEPGQAWTTSAVLAIKRRHSTEAHSPPDALEASVMDPSMLRHRARVYAESPMTASFCLRVVPGLEAGIPMRSGA